MFTAHYRIVCVVLICIAVCASLSLVHTSTPPSKENYATPNDSLFVQQWNLKTGSGLNGINAIFGWDIYTGNSNVIVGVLEDGIQMEHPDFDPTRMYGDDVPSSAHGTMVAGIIAAKANNGRGTAGIDWACKIQWYNKFPDQNLDLLAEQIDSISAAHITNCSWGKNWSNDGNANSDVYISFIDLYNRNILNVAGQGPNAFPEEFPYGTLRVNGILKSSNSPFEYNQNPDVVAPTGTETATPEFRIWAPTSGGGYSTIGETSAATPHVTGVAAMLLGFAMSRGEVLYADDLAWLIKRTAQPRGGAVPDPTFGYGLVDLNGALRGISQGKVVNHYSAVGTVVAQQDLGVMEHSFPHIRGLSDDVLVVEMYTVEASFDLNATFVDNPAVWTRPAQSGTTKSGGGNNGWKHVDLTETSPKVYRLRGYVYHLRTILGGVADPEWWPAPPGQAVLAMSAWGEPALVAPVEQVALSPNYHKVNLQWNDPNRNETGIFIQRRTSTGN